MSLFPAANRQRLWSSGHSSVQGTRRRKAKRLKWDSGENILRQHGDLFDSGVTAQFFETKLVESWGVLSFGCIGQDSISKLLRATISGAHHTCPGLCVPIYKTVNIVSCPHWYVSRQCTLQPAEVGGYCSTHQDRASTRDQPRHAWTAI